MTNILGIRLLGGMIWRIIIFWKYVILKDILLVSMKRFYNIRDCFYNEFGNNFLNEIGKIEKINEQILYIL